MPQRQGAVGNQGQISQHGFTDSDIKELSYDIGVDARHLKMRL